MKPEAAPGDQASPGYPLVTLTQILEEANDEDAVSAAFQTFITTAGFSCFTCRRFQPAGTVGAESILVSTTPTQWREAHDAQGWGTHNPILSELSRRSYSFIWSEALNSRTLTPPQQDVMREAAALGLVDGFGISIHEAGGFVGTVTLSAEKVRIDPAERTALSLASVYVYQRLCALRAAAQRGAGKRLSPREIEILHWIIEGKSDWQIGRILAISDKTVNYHIENVKRKFGVATRVQAVVSAIQQGSVAY